MELRKRILVVDDDLQNRKGKYASALQGKYEVEYTENADLIFDVIKTVKADLYIVDLDLSSFIDPRTMQSMTVNAILETIGKSKPIILLSGTYKELMDKENREMLQDMVLVAFNDAQEKVAKDREEKLGSITQGVNFPGM